MRIHHSLRFRIVAAFALSGALLGVLYGGLSYSLTRNIEDEVVIDQLAYEATYFSEQLARDPEAAPPSSGLLKGFIGRDNIPEGLRKILKDDKPGVYEYYLADYHVLIHDLPDREAHLYLFHYDKMVEPLEDNWVLAVFWFGVLFMVLVNTWFGFMIAKRAIAPLSRLAGQFAHTDPGHLPTTIQGPFYDDEVGSLANVLQTSMTRIARFVARGQKFSRNASHELRTPVTVIKGATELIDKLNEHNKPITAPLRRINRAVKDMENIIETFLHHGRDSDQPETPPPKAVAPIVENAAMANLYLLEEKPVTVSMEIRARFKVPAPNTVIGIAVGNLLRNAYQYTAEGEVTIVLGEGWLTIQDSGPGIDREALGLAGASTNEPKGFGLGLSIVNDFCKTRQWKLTLEGEAGHGTLARLDFADSVSELVREEKPIRLQIQAP